MVTIFMIFFQNFVIDKTHFSTNFRVELQGTFMEFLGPGTT